MRPENDKQQKDNDDLLKKIQSETSEEKRAKAMNILKGNNAQPKKPTFNYFQLAKTSLSKTLASFSRKLKRQQVRSSIMVTVFLIVSTYMCWSIEEKYDHMRKKATVTKTFKQAKIDEQDQRISKFLNQTEFESVPIKDEQEEDENYQYENSDSFNTKQYLLQSIAKEYKMGHKIDERYEKQLRDKGLI